MLCSTTRRSALAWSMPAGKWHGGLAEAATHGCYQVQTSLGRPRALCSTRHLLMASILRGLQAKRQHTTNKAEIPPTFCILKGVWQDIQDVHAGAVHPPHRQLTQLLRYQAVPLPSS